MKRTIEEDIERLSYLKNTYRHLEGYTDKDREFFQSTKDAYDDAIEALEKQKPEKPKKIGGWYLCKCGFMPLKHSNYCLKCGKKLDWSGV